MSVSGYLQIKTKINNDEIDKDIKQLEDKIKKLQIDNSQKSEEQSGLEKQINDYHKLEQEAEKYRQKLKVLEQMKKKELSQNPNAVVSNKISNPSFAATNQLIEEYNNKLKTASAELTKQAPKVDRISTKLAKIKAKQSENNAKVSEYKQKIESIKTQHIENSVNQVGKGISRQISQIGRMAMGIVGIQTAWRSGKRSY